jgi:hypothetical protein
MAKMPVIGFCVVKRRCLVGGYHRFRGTAKHLHAWSEKWHCRTYKGSFFLPLLKQESRRTDVTSLILNGNTRPNQWDTVFLEKLAVVRLINNF